VLAAAHSLGLNVLIFEANYDRDLERVFMDIDAALALRIIRGQMHEEADTAHALTLLRERSERPSDLEC
jgi:hypothetical protein